MKGDRRMKMEGLERFRPKAAQAGFEKSRPRPRLPPGREERMRARGRSRPLGRRWVAAEPHARMGREMGRALFPRAGPNAQ